MSRDVRVLGGLLAAVAGASVIALPGLGASERGSAVAIRPVADAYVSSAAPRRNFGRTRALVVASRPRARAYLRFRIRGVKGNQSARLRLFVLRGRGNVKVAAVRSNRWAERRITYRSAPRPAAAGSVAVARRGRWTEVDVTRLVRRSGVATLAVGSSRGRISIASRESGSRAPRLVFGGAPAGGTVIAAAGNIACDPLAPAFNGGAGTATECRQRSTSDLLVGAGLQSVLTLGDAQYACGGYRAYQQVFHPTWGRVKSLIRPVLGNHDYRPGPLAGTDCDPSARPSGYFRYFGAAAGPATTGYYSFDLGGWHLIALNTNCDAAGGCGPGSPQEAWLRADLAAHRTRCTLAFMHHPRFSSSYEQAENTYLDAIWRALYAARVEVVLAGHNHVYERFAPQNPAGRADPNGIRQFIVGTGGVNHHPFFTVQPNSEVRNNTSFGVLRLMLRAAGYDWRFVPAAGATFTDSGSGSCR